MARGKQLDNQTVYNIMSLYAVNNNYSETARQLKLAVKTVEETVKKNRDKDEFAILRKDKKQEFSEKCSEVLDILLEAAKRKAKAMIANKRTLGKTKLTEITTAIGTLYDKRALAQGDSTENITFTMPDEIKKYAE